jgi:hypothetical protein
MPIRVADQNLFNPTPGGVRDRLAAESDLQVVIPDAALVEMCKGETWAQTFELGLGELRGFEDQVILSASIYDVLAEELATGVAATSEDVLPPEVQPAVHTLLRSVGEGTWTQADAVRAQVEEIQKDIQTELLDAGQARDITAALVATWHDGLTPALLKALSSTKVDPDFVRAFIVAESYSLCVRISRDRMELSEEQTLEFIRAQPLMLRYLLAMARHSLRLARNGKDSVAQTAAWKELNNRLDIEYVLIATYVDGFMSKDRRAEEAYEELRAMLDMPLAHARQVRDEGVRALGLTPPAG